MAYIQRDTSGKKGRVKINACYQSERRIKKKLSCFGGKIFFLGLTYYHDSEISNPETLGTLVTLIYWFRIN